MDQDRGARGRFTSNKMAPLPPYHGRPDWAWLGAVTAGGIIAWGLVALCLVALFRFLLSF